VEKHFIEHFNWRTKTPKYGAQFLEWLRFMGESKATQPVHRTLALAPTRKLPD
jgi:hypothetical protein